MYMSAWHHVFTCVCLCVYLERGAKGEEKREEMKKKQKTGINSGMLILIGLFYRMGPFSQIYRPLLTLPQTSATSRPLRTWSTWNSV